MERFFNQKRSVLIFVIVLLFIAIKSRKRKKKKRKHNNKAWNYKLLNQMIKANDISVPAMFVDLDVFEQNVKMLASIAQKHNKTLRLATKSIRCPYLIEHALKIANGTLKGLMCFSVQEANALVEYAMDESNETNQENFTETFNDFLIAYPTVQRSDIETAYKLTEKGIKISLMVDCVQHIRIIDEICNALYCSSSKTSNGPTNKVNICIDLDMSYRIRAIGLRLGAHRSNAYDEYDIDCILNEIIKSKFLQLSGVMSYEANVAGLPDTNPYKTYISNWLVRRMKHTFQNDCNKRRQSLVQYIQNKITAVIDEGNRNNNLNSFSFVNAGGTGNIHLVSKDKYVTEVTAGSGLLQSKLFDYYMYDNGCRVSAAFALQITRISIDERYITCQSGGFIASGSISKDKMPMPFLPRKQIYGPFKNEGFGEVQTPLSVRDASIFNFGDSVFFRPAKAGEIAECFAMYILKRGDKIQQKVPTYRGMGYAFY